MIQLTHSGYDSKDCQIGVVHIGFGAFHRAHQAVYIDDYMSATGDLRWGIAAVNLLASQSQHFKQISAQQSGYVLKTHTFDGGVNYRKVNVHVAYHDWPSARAQTEALFALPSVKIATITVTESGYALDDQGGLNIHTDSIRNEIAGQSPTSIYGYLRKALENRQQAGAGAITLLSCDNLRHNGKLLRQNFLAYLEKCNDTKLYDWVTRNVTFPCCMVDRITPRPTQELTHEIHKKFDVYGDNAVMAESFIQWVIEDNFAAARPALEKVGVQLVDDVDPFEESKIRILNGGHTALVYMGALSGYKTFDQLMHAPELQAHFHMFQDEEVIPALKRDLSGRNVIDLDSYKRVVANRFANPHIADSVARIAMDGFSKFTIFVLPTIKSCYEMGKIPQYALKSIAAWYYFIQKSLKGEIDFDYIEPQMSVLEPLMQDPSGRDFAAAPILWGTWAQQHPSFVSDLISAIQACDPSSHQTTTQLC